jgi:hypothetical protein
LVISLFLFWFLILNIRSFSLFIIWFLYLHSIYLFIYFLRDHLDDEFFYLSIFSIIFFVSFFCFVLFAGFQLGSFNKNIGP